MILCDSISLHLCKCLFLRDRIANEKWSLYTEIALATQRSSAPKCNENGHQISIHHTSLISIGVAIIWLPLKMEDISISSPPLAVASSCLHAFPRSAEWECPGGAGSDPFIRYFIISSSQFEWRIRIFIHRTLWLARVWKILIEWKKRILRPVRNTHRGKRALCAPVRFLPGVATNMREQVVGSLKKMRQLSLVFVQNIINFAWFSAFFHILKCFLIPEEALGGGEMHAVSRMTHRLNCLGQRVHEKGRSPVWRRRCLNERDSS